MTGSTSGMLPSDVESAQIAALRRGEEDAFETLILRHHTSLVRLARVWVRDAPAAEEVAQETWMAVIQGIHTFEGRASLQSCMDFRDLGQQGQTKRGPGGAFTAICRLPNGYRLGRIARNRAGALLPAWL